MPQISIVIPHHLTQEEAIARVKEKAASVRETYQNQVANATDHWEGNTLPFHLRRDGECR